MSLLDGLESLGLGNVENRSIYDEQKKPEKKRKKEEKNAPEKMKEADFLFDKSYECPICDRPFKVKTVRAGKARLIGSDSDLRPKYEIIDVLKYDTVVCPHCGYSALSRYFKYMTNGQAKLIKQEICENYIPHKYNSDTYSYEEAMERYKLVLANAVVKRAKPSEKAYICLKSGWLLRGMAEQLKIGPEYIKKKITYNRLEQEYLKNAYEGFLSARSAEPFPLCGMDEATVDYLLAALSIRFKDFEVAERLITDMITSKSINSRTKEKARLLKEEMTAEKKKFQKEEEKRRKEEERKAKKAAEKEALENAKKEGEEAD